MGGEEAHCELGDAEGCQQATNGDASYMQSMINQWLLCIQFIA
jgi:hypothetical protein